MKQISLFSTLTALSAIAVPTNASTTGSYMATINISDFCPASVSDRRTDAAYGTVVHETYASTTTGLNRGVNILLPADYSEDKKYPVLYLLHGIGGNENVLIHDGNNKVVEIVGNQIADGTAKDMIVVLPNIFATSDSSMVSGFNAESIAAYDNFINDLTNDLMPFINKKYSTIPDRDHQAIAGFSMGGRETLFIGLMRPDLFGYVCAIAPAPGLTPGKDWALTHKGQLSEDEVKYQDGTETPYVLLVCCGTNDGVVGKFPESYHTILTTNNVEHIWYTIPDADHDSQAIRSGLNNFLPNIFHTDNEE